MEFLVNCGINGISIQGMGFIWEVHYGTTNFDCPKTDPLERVNGRLIPAYSICQVTIDLEIYNPLIINFNNEPIVLTPSLLFDYGLVYQMIFRNPRQVHQFGRKIATCVLNAFAGNFKAIELRIRNKPPEWANDGRIYPAQHLILLHAYFQNEPILNANSPSPCKYPLSRQICHWTSRIIAKNLDYGLYESSHNRPITEDNTQKIISNIDNPNISFLYQTHFSYLIDYYQKEHQEYLKTCGIPFCQSFPYIDIL